MVAVQQRMTAPAVCTATQYCHGLGFSDEQVHREMVLDPTSTFRCVLACFDWKRSILTEIYLRRACSYHEK
eukprot:COSAG01_NODE_1441_length_10293_cov_4.232392_17_plen_71_part_00